MKKLKLVVVSIILVTLIATLVSPVIYAETRTSIIDLDENTNGMQQTTDETVDLGDGSMSGSYTGTGTIVSPGNNNVMNNDDSTNTNNTNDTQQNTTEKIDADTFKANKLEEYGEPVVIINNNKVIGINSNDIALYFSKTNMPTLQLKTYKNGTFKDIDKSNMENLGIIYKDSNILESSSSDVSISNNGVLSLNSTGNTFLEFVLKYEYEENGETKTEYIHLKTIYIVKVDIDSTRYNITLDSDLQNGVSVITNNGEKQIIIEKGVTTKNFKYEYGYDTLFDDVVAEIDNESIATVSYGYYGSIKVNALSVGETKITFTGSSVINGKMSINIKVVDNLYDYDKAKDEEKKNENNENEDNTENDDVIPDDFDYTKYDEREDVNSDYETLNEELLSHVDTVEVTVEGDHVVKSSVFETLKNYPGKKLIVNSTASGVGRISWEFSSDTITNTNIDFKPSADFSGEKLDNINNNEVDSGIFLDLAHSGELPGRATVSLWIGDELAEKYIDSVNESIYLYYYNPETNEYEYMGTAKMVDYGVVEFELEHCSIYLLSSSKIESTTTRPLDEEPKTGVENHIYLAGAIAILSIAGIVIIRLIYVS